MLVELTSKPRAQADSGGQVAGALADGPASRNRPVPHHALAGSGPKGPELLALDAGEQYRFGFDMSACIGCHSCEVACAEQNGLPAGTAWRRVGEIEGGEYPASRRFNLSMSCNHCLEPACLIGCPTNAYEKLPNGVVAHHADDCIGCRYCTWNCPYSVPVFQPDRRIVTKCDMCQPRLAEGLAPACVNACPTRAITIEKVDVAAWRADHASADAPELPSAEITLSTTRIVGPPGITTGTYGASDWNLRPEHPHWPLVWLTLLSQVAVGVSLTGWSGTDRLVAAGLALASLAGAQLHLGRPAMAFKALRNLRRSWLSREVALLGAYALAAVGALALPGLAVPAALLGVAGVFASARLYMVPGRPAWDTQLTVVRFFATAVALGGALTGHLVLAAAGAAVALGATAANWWRLRRNPSRAWRGSVQIEVHQLGRWTKLRLVLAGAGAVVALAVVGAGLAHAGAAHAGVAHAGAAGAVSGASASLWVFALLLASEAIGRWLFYVSVVPLNMPGSFWRGSGGSDT